MNSLKTGVIIAFGLTVLYGVYLVINKPEPTAEAKAEADAVEELSIGDSGEAEESPDVAKSDHTHKSNSDATHTHDHHGHDTAPAIEVADRNKPGSHSGSRFHKDDEAVTTDDSTAPTTGASEPSTDADGAEPKTQESELRESDVRPWRKKPESAAESEDIKEAAPVEPQKSRFGNEEKVEEPTQDESTEKVAPKVAESQEKAQAKVKVIPREAPALTAAEFDAAWNKMEQEIEEGKLKEALTTISPFYHATDLTADDQDQLREVLDLLAWRVVFSKEHFLAKPHIVAAGETLEDIAATYEVPSEVIAKINGIKSAKLLTAGTELKVLPGPFRAEVSTDRGELTLFLGDLYATSYAVESGTEPPPMAGDYEVVRRAPGATYPTRANREISAQDPRNPYGGVFLDLGNDQCIHGSPEKESGEALGTGCMRLRGKDAKEVYWLLSKGSKVTVQR